MGNSFVKQHARHGLLHHCYMIVESERRDLQLSHLFLAKAEGSRSAKTNSGAAPAARLVNSGESGYWSFGLRQQVLQAHPADHQGKDFDPCTLGPHTLHQISKVKAVVCSRY
jgi:hypothetical protein